MRQSWTRRAIRMLTVSKPPSSLLQMTIDDCRLLRDTEWEQRECGFHDVAIDDLNAIVRRYNGVAPAAVRRSYYARSAEIQKAYIDGAEDIIRGVRERVKDSRIVGGPSPASHADEEQQVVGTDTQARGTFNHVKSLKIRDLIKDWLG